MDIRIQKHMLEHADGSGPPGVVINYNCQDFSCEADLIDKLAEFVKEYPAYVYLAPFSMMSAKIVLTRLGEMEILDEFDEDKIRSFIKKR